MKSVASLQKERLKCRRKFLYYFRKGFKDPKYIDWERNYKWEAHLTWQNELNRYEYQLLLSAKEYSEIAKRAVRLESRTNLLFSFEKMALCDAVNSSQGAKAFAEGLYHYVYADEPLRLRFEAFSGVLASLPRRQTRVLTWPLLTLFGFVAIPEEFIFLKPRVTQIAAKKYEYSFTYESTPNWRTYQNFLDFAEQISEDVADLHPRDMIDLQSFMWVLGSEEYPD